MSAASNLTGRGAWRRLEMNDVDVIFEITRGKRSRIASLTVAVDRDAPVDALNQQVGDRLTAECARRGVTPKAVLVEAQANFLTGGMDLTAAAHVRPVKAQPRKRAVCRALATRSKGVADAV
jgi:hypothetical protein